mmetsp:Transcript_23168/g.60579  ORF Transcript_23168/g.60579 Transcript_23168/m.60579 type:complete len:144 (-) Transcript_23168:9-440(-)
MGSLLRRSDADRLSLGALAVARSTLAAWSPSRPTLMLAVWQHPARPPPFNSRDPFAPILPPAHTSPGTASGVGHCDTAATGALATHWGTARPPASADGGLSDPALSAARMCLRSGPAAEGGADVRHAPLAPSVITGAIEHVIG